MLQQTRVETVLPYYRRFMNRFPTLEELAAAPVQAVLGRWSGLGYYRRARMLHQAARQIMQQGGAFPRTLEALLALPGVGAYTAAAVGSIAFGLEEPSVDGNVRRVLSRVFGITGDPHRATHRQELAELGRAVLHSDRPGDSNQALMDLGAAICRPRGPKCEICPLRGDCVAALSGDPERFPGSQRRPTPVRIHRRVAVVREQGRYLLFRRPDDSSLLAGMWELPWVECQDDGACREEFARRYGGRWKLGESRGFVRHSITRRRFVLEVMEARREAAREVAESREAAWFGAEELTDLPVSAVVWKVLEQSGLQTLPIRGR
jgi:A/G-specific adenine glycosylase